MVRYPSIRVDLRTHNPLALVAAVRDGMRRAGVAPGDIAEFSTEALAGDPSQIRSVCASWVATPNRPGSSDYSEA